MEERVVVPVTAPHRRSIPADAFLGMILLHCRPYHPLVRISAYPPVCCLCQMWSRLSRIENADTHIHYHCLYPVRNSPPRPLSLSRHLGWKRST